jgi:ABC-type uncharacterized transport system permease subunit
MMNKLFGRRGPLFHVEKRSDFPAWKAWMIRISSIIVGLCLAYLMMLVIAKATPEQFFKGLVDGAFGGRNQRKTWVTLREAAILLTVSLALIPAFKMKFWNLGGNGQVLMGDLAAIMCMHFLGAAGVPDWAIILVMIPASILAGIIWALIPAIFKAIFNTNETLFTLMMNYIAVGLVSVFINAVVKTGSGTLLPRTHGNIPAIANQPALIPIIMAGVVLILIYVYLRFSRHGYELEVVGESQNTARYIGINVKKVIIRTMIVSGSICGLVGLVMAGALNHTISATSDGNLGFTGTMVAWLSQFNPIFMVFTSFLVSFLNNGMSQVLTSLKITNTAVSALVIGLVYFTIIAAEFFVSYKIVPTHKGPKQNKKLALVTAGLLDEEPVAEESVKEEK